GRGGEWCFVGEIVLARFHRAATDGAALAGHGCGGDEFDVLVLEDFVERAGNFYLWVFRDEVGDFFRIGIVDPFQLGAGLEESVALAENVPVIEVRRGKNKLARFDDGSGFALGGVIHPVGFLTHGAIFFPPSWPWREPSPRR